MIPLFSLDGFQISGSSDLLSEPDDGSMFVSFLEVVKQWGIGRDELGRSGEGEMKETNPGGWSVDGGWLGGTLFKQNVT